MAEDVVAFVGKSMGPELDAFSASFTSALKRPFHIDWCLSFSSELVKGPVTLADSVASLTVPKFTDEFVACCKAFLHVFPFSPIFYVPIVTFFFSLVSNNPPSPSGVHCIYCIRHYSRDGTRGKVSFEFQQQPNRISACAL